MTYFITESFAGSLDIAEYSPPNSPYHFNTTSVLLDTATQLLQLRPTETTPTVVMETPEQIIVSQDDIPKCSEAEVESEEVQCQDTPVHIQDTDGIQYVAYSTPLEEGHGSTVRRSARKRQTTNYIAQNNKQTRKQ